MIGLLHWPFPCLSSHSLFLWYFRFSNVTLSGKSSWVTILKYFPQPLSAAAFFSHSPASFSLGFWSLPQLIFLFNSLLVFLFQPSCLQCKCHWEQGTCVCHCFCTVFTTWKWGGDVFLLTEMRCLRKAGRVGWMHRHQWDITEELWLKIFQAVSLC